MDYRLRQGPFTHRVYRPIQTMNTTARQQRLSGNDHPEKLSPFKSPCPQRNGLTGESPQAVEVLKKESGAPGRI
jgi:hypothetical protein